MKRNLFVCFFVLTFVLLASVAIADHSKAYIQASQAYNAGDLNKAFQLWLIEAGKGDVDAQMKIGAMYTEGLGVDRNDEEAAKWYRIAAEDGDVSAQLLLGKMYLEGRGLSQSAEYAYAWWLVAAANGNKTARQKRVAIEANMTPEQIKNAQQRAIEILLTLGD